MRFYGYFERHHFTDKADGKVHTREIIFQLEATTHAKIISRGPS